MRELQSPADILAGMVAIPSFLGEKNNEIRLARFIESFLKKFPFLEVGRQPVEKGRFNVVARTKKRSGPSVLFAGHMDTVEPKQGWKTDQFKLLRKGDNLSGLGALDMKGGIAAMLSALSRLEKTPDSLVFLFYCDEEYDFKGMKKFLSRQNGKIGFAVVGENSDLKIWNAHRGLIEIHFAIEGKTGHAANPSAGRNAIAVTSKILEDIREWLSGFRHKVLGIPSLNIAYLRGGLKLEEGKIGEIALGRQGNNIADYCEGVLDIRTTDTRLRAKAVVSKLAWFAKSHDVRLADWEVRHDLGSLYTNPQEIRAVSEIVRELTGSAEMFLNPGSRGYGDGQMIQEKLEIPVINFGPAGKNEHSAGEFVTLSSLEKASEVYRELMESWPEIRRQFSADSR